MTNNTTDRTMQGAYFALTAYLFWGVVPIYFKWVDHVSPWEILAHRVIWAVILLVGILAIRGELHVLRIERNKWLALIASALLLSVNWLVFIYAVVNDNISETSLGYYINPLVTVFLGILFLGERPRNLQWLAIAIAGAGILGQLLLYGQIPWLGLALAFSFGFYGLIRKNLNLHAIGGLALESMIVAPVCIVYLAWLSTGDDLAFGLDRQTDFLLILGGFVTAFPLLCFAAAVTRLSLTAIGGYQYIAPSLSLVLAVFVYNEPFDTPQMLTFGAIWIALVLYSWDAYKSLQIR